MGLVHYFYVCEFSENVVDIREQYPLLPRESAQAIASSIGVRYPSYPKSTIPYVMTTDFLLSVKQDDGSFKSVARTIKYRSDLEGKSAKRTLEKLEIEKRFWSVQGVDWAIVTDELFTTDLIKNLGLIRKFSQLPRTLLQPSLHKKFLEHFESSRPFQWTTAECLRKISSRLFVSYIDIRSIYLHLIWTKAIKIDLSSTPILMTAPLPDFEIVLNSADASLAMEKLP